MEKINPFEALDLNPENKLETPEEIMARYKGERNEILKEFLKKAHQSS